MALFKKKVGKQEERAEEYTVPEQTPEPVEKKEECDCAECEKLRKILANQTIIVNNQQVILDSITNLQTYIASLTQEEEAEPTQEEIDAAIRAARAAKKGKA